MVFLASIDAFFCSADVRLMYEASPTARAQFETTLSCTLLMPCAEDDGLEDSREPGDMELDAYTSGYDAMEDGARSEWDNPILVSNYQVTWSWMHTQVAMMPWRTVLALNGTTLYWWVNDCLCFEPREEIIIC